MNDEVRGTGENPAPDAAATRPDPEHARPAVVRVCAFLIERFPPVPQLVLMVVLFVAATTMSALTLVPTVVTSIGDIEPVPAVCGLLASLIFVVRLRVFDDVKDADTDRIDNPTRPIPRGLVSVREMDVTGAALLVIEGLLMTTIGGVSLWLWVMCAVWSVLMRVEFFAPSWLNRHVASFAVSHMIVLGMLYVMLMAIGIEARHASTSIGDLLSSGAVLGAFAASTLIGVGFEWGRKFERYHEVHGERAWTLWMLWPSLGTITFTVLVRETYPIWAVLVLVVISLVTIFGHALIMGQRDQEPKHGGTGAAPTGGLRVLVEQFPGGSGFLVYVVLASAGIVEVVRA